LIKKIPASFSPAIFPQSPGYGASGCAGSLYSQQGGQPDSVEEAAQTTGSEWQQQQDQRRCTCRQKEGKGHQEAVSWCPRILIPTKRLNPTQYPQQAIRDRRPGEGHAKSHYAQCPDRLQNFRECPIVQRNLGLHRRL